MNVLVLAYYFPPLGLSGVQRTTKFVKYLHRFGWHPIVLTPRPAGYFARDPSLLEDLDPETFGLIRTGSLDPTRLAGSGEVAFPREETRKRFSMVSQFVFMPDNKIGWYPLALRAALQLARTARIDAVYSTAPPYTAHLVGRRVSKRLGIPLVLDYRDDWIDNPRHRYPTSFHRRLHEQLERRAVDAASHIVAINPVIAGAIEARHPHARGRVSVIPQGYDPEDFRRSTRSARTSKCQFLYAGVFYDAQSPGTFLRAIAAWRRDNPVDADSIVVSFAGLLSEASMQLVTQLGLDEVVEILGYVPHREACERMLRADVLWMTIGDVPGAHQISTGKLYEYFGTKKPIIGLVPDGVAANDLQRYSAGTVVHPDDVDGTRNAIDKLFRCWQSDGLPEADQSEVEQYDRHRTTGELARILSAVTASGVSLEATGE